MTEDQKRLKIVEQRLIELKGQHSKEIHLLAEAERRLAQAMNDPLQPDPNGNRRAIQLCQEQKRSHAENIERLEQEFECLTAEKGTLLVRQNFDRNRPEF